MSKYATAVANTLAHAPEAPTPDARGPYSEAVGSILQQQAADLRKKLRDSVAISPDQAARDYGLSKATGLPSYLVARNRDAIEAELSFEGLDIGSLERNAPNLARMVRERNLGGVVRDDVQSMSYLERWAGDFGQAATRGLEMPRLGKIGLKALLGNELTPDEQNELNRSRYRRPVDYDIGFVPGIPGAVAEMGPLYLDSALTAGLVSAVPAAGAGALGAAAGGPGAGLAAAGTTFAGTFRLALPATFATQEAGLAYNEFSVITDDAGNPIDPDAARGAAVVVGLINGWLETLGFRAVTRPISEAAKGMLRRGAGREALVRIGRAMIEGGTVEGVTEGIQELVNTLGGEFAKMASGEEFNAFGGGDPEQVQAFLQETIDRVMEGATRGAQGGIGMGGGAAVVSTAADSYMRRVQFRSDQEKIQEGVDLARQSKTAQRSPEAFEEIIRESNARGETFRIPANRLQEFFQDAPERFAAFAQYIPEVQSQMREALEVGGDILLPPEKVLSMAARTEDFNDLIAEMRIRPDGWSEREAQEYAIEQAIAEVDAYAQDVTQGQLIQREVERQLMNAGQTPEAARLQAALYGSAFDTLVARGNDTGQVEAAFQGGPRIQRVLPEALRRPDALDPIIDRARKIAKGEVRTPAQPKGQARPVLNVIRGLGGVRIGSALDAELRNIGVTPKTAPGLFKREGGVGDVDNLVRSEFPLFENAPVDQNDYVDREWLLEQVREEMSGRPLDQGQQAEVTPEDALIEALQNTGVNLAEATNEQVKDALAELYAQPVDVVGGVFEQAPPVESEAFRRWFGDSKVVDADGKPLVVYHGTRADFDRFSADQIGVRFPFSDGFYFTSDPLAASVYADSAANAAVNFDPNAKFARPVQDGASVLPVHLSIRNPFVVDGGVNGEASIDGADVIARAKDAGHDGVIVRGAGGDVYVAFRPEQIKSVHNRGTFDPTDPRILFQGDARGSIQFMEQGQALIRLAPNADLSTFLHESGHFFLEVVRTLSSAETAPQQVQDDGRVLLDWFGVETWDQVGTPQHEQFARGFEAYLMEGNAPSVGLRDAFRRFKAWLVRIYREMRNLDVKLTDDVRAVMDRLLATDEQIEEARGNPLFRPDPAIMEMLTSAEKADYQRRGERAAAEAKEAMFKRMLRQKEREARKWWKAERASVRAEIEEQVNRTPIYQVLHYLQTGKMLVGDTPEDMKHERLSMSGIKSLGYTAEVRKYLPRATVAKSGGVDPQVLAELYGIPTGRQLIDALIGIEDRKARIERLTDEEMRSRYGDMLTDGTIEREALEAIQNAERAEAIAYELRVISRRTGVQYPSNADFKEAARRYLADRKIDDAIAPSRFYHAEVRAAREAGKALGRKDYEKAAEWKRKQLLNHHLFREAREAREMVQKTLRRFGKLSRMPRKGTLPIQPEYHQQIWTLLEAYDLKPRMSDARRERLMVQAVSDWMDRKAADENAPLEMPQEILDAQNKTHYRDLTLDEFVALRDAVYNLEAVGRNIRKIVVEGQQRDLDNDAAEAARLIRENLPERKRSINPRRNNPIGRALDGIDALLLKASSAIEMMDGRKNGFIHKRLRARIMEGEVTRLNRLEVEAGKLDEIITRHYGKKEMRVGGVIRHVSKVDITSKRSAVFIPQINDSMTLEERLAVALNWGAEDNRAKLMAGRKWTEAQVDAIIDTLEQRDWQFVQDVWDYVDTFWPEVEALSRRMMGFPPAKVEAAPVDTKFGTMRGGYYPLVYDGLLNMRQSEQDIESELRATMLGRAARAQTRHGHRKERVANVQKPVMLTLDALSQHVNRVVTDITLAEPVADAWKFLKHREVESAIVDTMGIDAAQMLDMWLKDTAVGQIQASDALSRAFRGLRASVSVGAMGLKVSTTLIQISGFAQSVPVIGAKWLMMGVSDMMRAPVETVRMVHEASPWMKSRSTSFHRDVFDTLNSLQGKTWQHAWASAMFWPIARMQMMVDVPTWLGAYKKALADGASDADAIRSADLAVEQAQGAGFMSALSSVERGSLSANHRLSEVTKIWFSFYSYFNAKYNVARVSWKRTDFRKPGDVGRLIADYAFIFWFEALIGELILGRFPDDDEDKAGYFIGLGAMQAMATIPLLREVSSAVQGFNAAPAATRGLEDVARAGRAIGRSVSAAVDPDEDVDYFQLAKALVAGGNVVSPVKYPAGQVNVFIDALERQNEGEDVGPMNFLMYLEKE